MMLRPALVGTPLGISQATAVKELQGIRVAVLHVSSMGFPVPVGELRVYRTRLAFVKEVPSEFVLGTCYLCMS